MSTLILTTKPNFSGLQWILSSTNSKNNNVQWLPILLLKVLGYSSFAAAIVSMIVYWYKKQHLITQDNLIHHKMEETNDDELLHMKPVQKLHVSTAMMKRSSTSLSSLNQRSSSQLLTPPISPNNRSLSPTRSSSPRSWSSRLLDGVISAARKRKRMTISLKNTVLWNPSRDVNKPNHAFHENSVLLLNKLAQIYDIYVMIHMNSEQERHQIHQLLSNASLAIDPRKVLYCCTEQGKLHLIHHIQPTIHIEGGWELGDGSSIIRQLSPTIEQKIWIKSGPTGCDSSVEVTDNILKTCIAKQVGFD